MFLAALAAPLQAQGPAFSQSGEITSDTGHTLVEWQANGTATLDIAQEPDFSDARTLYSGNNLAYFVSGLSDGEYYLRVQASDGSTGEPLKLTVRHQSLQQALWLALLGAIVTLAVVFVIIRGAHDD